MTHFKIHPIVMGTKIFNKTMMTYQYGYGETYMIPMYAWYIEGSEKTILVDTGKMNPIQSKDRGVHRRKNLHLRRRTGPMEPQARGY